ncbi:MULTISPECIES: HlyD family type I secretion periplasmic adaptor subunit [unclassified Lentilitoribacter]|uniref:HlyD family type I secretion periplasmic adaptor subunit n=1 Tax=unclassified Lentilitoribacter TaxID=2647570 RepID=UPI0013A6A560|nr:HlyD family type I secretion periplasmic adaptor subunit [Lentilitoribacter sp. Alg239-R112]
MSNRDQVSGNHFILPAELDDDKSIAVMGRRANFICLIVLAAIIWSIFAPIDELVVANGEIIPTDRISSIEHREGGIVDKVMMKEGQKIRAGDTILELNPISTNADFNQIEIQSVSLELKLKSLEALLDRQELDFGKVGDDYPDLVAKERIAHEARATFIEKELASLKTNVALKTLEISSFENDIISLQRQLEIEQERNNSLEELLRAGHISRQEYLDSKSNLERLSQSLDAAKSQRDVATLQSVEAERVMESKIAQDKKLFLEEQTQILSELSQSRSQLTKQVDRNERLIIKSPIDGYVQELAQKTKGEVVSPGELVAKIVPQERKIVAEVKVDPYDIGHIKPGDTAEISISTFDPSIFGIANGQITVLSPSTFVTERGDAYYKAIISLDDNFVGEKQTKRFLHAGMVVDAKIKTGSKSLMRYMLKPVLKSFGASFSER